MNDSKAIRNILEYFDINKLEQDGKFVYIKHNGSRACPGKEAGTIHLYGYKQIMIDGSRFFAHVLVWLWHCGEFPNNPIRHIDGDRLNNRIENLLCANRKIGQKTFCNNTSGITGVYWHKNNKKWIAQITVNNRIKHLGTFSDMNDAVKARKMAEKGVLCD